MNSGRVLTFSIYLILHIGWHQFMGFFMYDKLFLVQNRNNLCLRNDINLCFLKLRFFLISPTLSSDIKGAKQVLFGVTTSICYVCLPVTLKAYLVIVTTIALSLEISFKKIL